MTNFPFGFLITLAVSCAVFFESAAAQSCLNRAYSVPSDSASRVSVLSFGAKADDDIDDSVAIQAALDSLKPRQSLYFPPGRYLFARSLRINVDGTSLVGTSATLHATNPDDQSLMVIGDGVSIFDFTLTAVTAGRKSTPKSHRISVVGKSASQDGFKPFVIDTLISGVNIRAADSKVPALSNAGSAAGIFVSHAQSFIIANNKISRTLADGIHITGGSRDGIITGNVVRETGDDSIAVVSYAISQGPSAPNVRSLADTYDAQADPKLTRNIVIDGNDVAENYWGRGITVIGGAAITIRSNRIHDIPSGTGAGILLAREQTYTTFGVENVLVEANTLIHIHDKGVGFNPGGRNVGRDNGHGAIELHSFVFEDEAASIFLYERLGIRNIMLKDNIFDSVAGVGIRAGVGSSGSRPIRLEDGKAEVRRYRTGSTSAVSLVNNSFTSTGPPVSIQVAGSDLSTFSCVNNRRDKTRLSIPSCADGNPLQATGASIVCDPNGHISVGKR